MQDTKFLMELAIDKNNLEALLHLIIDNARLSYDNKDLKINNEDTIMQFVKYLYPSTYRERLEKLQEETNICQE